jgi:pimeloyl-ACP methyl ester carboxylesterase
MEGTRRRFRYTRRLANAIARWFQEMFTTKSNPAVVAAVVERAGSLPSAIGEKVLLDMVRYDTDRLATSLGNLRVPVMAIQTTYSNERRERRSMTPGQTTPYLDMLRARTPSVRIEIIEDTGHFPQIDEPDNHALLNSFWVARLLMDDADPARG